MKRATNLLVKAYFILSLISTVSCGEYITHETSRQFEGKRMYAAANIWYKDPQVIYSINHHQGAILPVGTKVTIDKIMNKAVSFRDDTGARFKMILIEKYSGALTIEGFFRQYFTDRDPKGEGSEYQQLSDSDKSNIAMGRIEAGMRKAAVLMAYGYPPGHWTRSMDSDVWKYWIHKFRAKLVYFKDGKVEKIEDAL